LNKNSDYDRNSKELGIDNSPSDDFEINENELDENFNMNIYSDEGFEEMEKQCFDDQDLENGNENGKLTSFSFVKYYF
jgi:hypothetical protein